MRFDGEVVRLGKQADRETREFLVDVRVLRLPETWAIGQRVEVYIEMDRRDDCIRVPLDFLAVQGGESGAFVYEGGLARWHAVTTGLEGRDSIEILSGIEPGQEIVRPSESDSKLTDGRKVRKQ
jgi:hypothetical protein